MGSTIFLDCFWAIYRMTLPMFLNILFSLIFACYHWILSAGLLWSIQILLSLCSFFQELTFGYEFGPDEWVSGNSDVLVSLAIYFPT